MADDLIGRMFLVVSVLAFTLFALRPDFAIKMLSYGRMGVGDVSPFLLRVVQAIAAFSAIWGTGYFVWSLIRK